MDDSILENVKEVLSVPESFDAFDAQILIYINSAIGVLAQVGLAPNHGLVVVDEESKWNEFGLTDSQTGLLKTYVGLKVRSIFDPPQTGFLVNALNDQIEELITRLHYSAETPSLTETI